MDVTLQYLKCCMTVDEEMETQAPHTFILLLKLTLLYLRSFACYCILHRFQLFEQLFPP